MPPIDPKMLGTYEFLLKVVAGLGSLLIFSIGLRRYVREQKWKRNEFVANEMKTFNSDPMVRNVMSILDWGSRKVELFPDKPDYNDRFVKVDRKLLKSALQFHEFKTPGEKGCRFTEDEVAIRDHFDRFLSYFERFEYFIKAKLIRPVELTADLGYWIDTISEDIEPDVRNFISHFIDRYRYRGTQNFFTRFKKDIKPKTDIETTRN